MPEELIFEKGFTGYESSYNILEEIEACFSPSENGLANRIPDEFKGTIKVRITYEKSPEDATSFS